MKVTVVVQVSWLTKCVVSRASMPKRSLYEKASVNAIYVSYMNHTFIVIIFTNFTLSSKLMNSKSLLQKMKNATSVSMENAASRGIHMLSVIAITIIPVYIVRNGWKGQIIAQRVQMKMEKSYIVGYISF